jgi:hypothetical protein
MEDPEIDDRIILMNHKELCIDMKWFIRPVASSCEHAQWALGFNTKQEIC